jgi:hypothetical protein
MGFPADAACMAAFIRLGRDRESLAAAGPHREKAALFFLCNMYINFRRQPRKK